MACVRLLLLSLYISRIYGPVAQCTGSIDGSHISPTINHTNYKLCLIIIVCLGNVYVE